jgi:hypothetical protein
MKTNFIKTKFYPYSTFLFFYIFRIYDDANIKWFNAEKKNAIFILQIFIISNNIIF